MESKYECPYCGKMKFTSQPGLTNHMKACAKKDRKPKVGDTKETTPKKEITDMDLNGSRDMDSIDFNLFYMKLKRQYLYDLNRNKPIGLIAIHFDHEEIKSLMSHFEKMVKQK